MAKLFVICGHGAGDPGACGNGYQEAERVRALGKRIKELGGSYVTLGDTSRNYYRDKGINSLTISKDTQIIELHMDSGAASARGGHVIIKAGCTPDKYDNALVAFIKNILPGRSQNLVGRDNLGNCNRAYSKGYPYRLVEFGFISNATDVNIFNTKLDEIAKGVLKAFDIPVSGSTSSSSSTTTKTETAKKDTTTSSSTTSKSSKLVAGTKYKLTNVTFYASSSAKTGTKKTGVYYVWSTEVVNGRCRMTNMASRVGKEGQVSGWIDTKEIISTSSSSSKATTSTTTSKKLTTGTAVKLTNASLYSSSLGSSVGMKSGTYYIWDEEVVNKRIRITNSPSNVGKGCQVTGWVSVSDCK